MRDRKKRNIIIGSLCCLLVFMSVGYALLSQVLNISGTANLTGSWNIYIASIEELKEGNTTTGKSVSASVSEDKLTANFNVELLKPGDYVEYKVVINNDGDINAVLRELIPNIQSNNMDILLTHSIIQGQILKEHSSTEFRLKVRFDEKATEIVQGGKTTFDIQMIYEQYDGDTSAIVDGVVPVTANDCFEVDDNGVITDYDYSCGTYVTVPGVVNGRTVTEISNYAFTDANMIAYVYNDNPAAIVVFDADTYALASIVLQNQYNVPESMLPNMLFMKGTEPTEQLAAYEPITYKLTQNGLETPISSVEYLDLSQATGLTKIKSGAFASSSDAQSLKYLNVEGIDSSAIENAAFDYSHLESLTIDTNLMDLVTDKFNATIDTVRIYPDEGTTEIPDRANSSADYKITANNLIIGEGITRIGDYAFANGWKIKSLEVPKGLIEIGNHAFQGNSLTTLELPSSLKTIGDSAFMTNTKLSTVYFEDNSKLESIGNSAFASSPITEINIFSTVNFPKSLKSIGHSAFANCGIDGTLVLQNLDLIEETAFLGNNFESVVLKNIDVIEQYAFQNNPSLTSVTINGDDGQYTESIGEYAFANNSIRSLYVHNVDTIGTSAFENNSIGDNSGIFAVSKIKHIGANAFANNPFPRSATTLNLRGIESIGDGAFEKTASSTNILNIYVDNPSVTLNGRAPTTSGTQIGNVNYYLSQ